MSSLKYFIKNKLEGRGVFWCWALIVLCSFGLFRLPGIGVPLASDELATVSLWAQMPYSKIFTNYQYPNNHISLTLILSFLLKTFGLKEWVLRLPVLVCGLASIYLSYQLSKKISGNFYVGLTTAFLMVTSEKHIFFSTNARGYLVVMVLALMVVHCFLKRIEGRGLKILGFSSSVNDALALTGWLSIWILATWTIPTFIFFEVSIALLIAGCLLSVNVLTPAQKKSLFIPLFSTVLGCIGFYLQYYVLMEPAMLAEATSHAAQTSLPLFFPELLNEWISPFESAGLLFFLFALIGLARKFQGNRVAGILLAWVWVGPVLIAIAGFILEKLPGVPHSRTFFYLQPFFLLLSVMGAEQATIGCLARIFHEKEVANPFQAIRIRLSDHSKKGIRRDRLYTRPT